MKAIIITGTPGTGKSKLAAALSKITGARHIRVGQLIKKEHLSEGYDPAKKCQVVDEKKLAAWLAKLIDSSERKLIIDSHLAHYIDRKHVELCIVTRCSLKELAKRLAKRGYGKQKIKDNLEAEIFQVCLDEAREKGHKLMILDTTAEKPALLARKVVKVLK